MVESRRVENRTGGGTLDARDRQLQASRTAVLHVFSQNGSVASETSCGFIRTEELRSSFGGKDLNGLPQNI